MARKTNSSEYNRAYYLRHHQKLLARQNNYYAAHKKERDDYQWVYNHGRGKELRKLKRRPNPKLVPVPVRALRPDNENTP